MRVDVAIWLSAAGLHEAGRASFSRADLLREVSRKFPDAGASAALYIDVHVKATANRGQIAYNYIYPIARATYRLCRIDDSLTTARAALPLWPDESDVDQAYRPLWDKWHMWQAVPSGASQSAAAAQEEPAEEAILPNDEDEAHFRRSSYREAMLEHVLVGELMRALWPEPLEVCKPQVDAAGYDLILQYHGVQRHVQLKTSTDHAATREVNVHVELAARTGGCVIWSRFNPDNVTFTDFWWFGGAPGQSLPDISCFKVGRHTKANAQGVKAERLSLRKVPQSAFIRVASVTDLIKCLFGEEAGTCKGIS